MKSTIDNLAIQIREQPLPGACDVAINTATAMRVGTTIVELAGTRMLEEPSLRVAAAEAVLEALA